MLRRALGRRYLEGFGGEDALKGFWGEATSLLGVLALQQVPWNLQSLHRGKGRTRRRPWQVWGEPAAGAWGVQAVGDGTASLHLITTLKTGAAGLHSLSCTEEGAPHLARLPCTPNPLCRPTGSRVGTPDPPGERVSSEGRARSGDLQELCGAPWLRFGDKQFPPRSLIKEGMITIFFFLSRLTRAR